METLTTNGSEDPHTDSMQIINGCDSQIIQVLISNEDQFCVEYDREGQDGVGVRVAHWKGHWKIMRSDGVWLEYADCGGVIGSTSKLLSALMKEIELNFAKAKKDSDSRYFPSLVISDLLSKWITDYDGTPARISKITVIQHGRNGDFDTFDGEWNLDPR